jgi:hypothetical protein|tara:strand:+ start:379 stop:585 length:207 start_codon:yes stop_codon:yes gene_type:complete
MDQKQIKETIENKSPIYAGGKKWLAYDTVKDEILSSGVANYMDNDVTNASEHFSFWHCGHILYYKVKQ